MSISRADAPRRCAAAWKETEDGNTLVISDAGYRLAVLQLNGTGSFIWGLCDGETSLEAICARVTKEFALDQRSEEEISHEIASFIDDLEHEKLVKW